MAENSSIKIMTLRVEEVYLNTTPFIGYDDTRDVELEYVWLRSFKHPQLIVNHSVYKDEHGAWWWYNDRSLIRLPRVKPEWFRNQYDIMAKPNEEYHHSGFNIAIDVMVTAQV